MIRKTRTFSTGLSGLVASPLLLNTKPPTKVPSKRRQSVKLGLVRKDSTASTGTTWSSGSSSSLDLTAIVEALAYEERRLPTTGWDFEGDDWCDESSSMTSTTFSDDDSSTTTNYCC
jgi:hypothetical protein